MGHEERPYWLSTFVVELHKENGELYMPSSLQHYLKKKNGYADLNIFSNPLYKTFSDSLDSQMNRGWYLHKESQAIFL